MLLYFIVLLAFILGFLGLRSSRAQEMFDDDTIYVPSLAFLNLALPHQKN
jgi:hypothetical protein